MLTTALPYANEYIGNTSRLVITPLTDRCYRTMMGAMKVNLGGAPEGPAGTGKTETVKDLSKAVAVRVLVFNCSEGIDYKSMAKLFKGLASAGAWSCFDEFNRIELEVLSVIAQQILAIQTAKTKESTTFDFDGSVIPLRPTCNIFITMNPGYVGRAELPDNLKALFRPAAMMVPDYAMIAEIRLYSTGFLHARAMAKKIVATYRLCSEQLSSQCHYDYGMRAVIAVLTAAGQLKRQLPDEKEELLTLRAIYDVNLPKFVAGDIQLFKWIISDLFPGSSMPSEQERQKELLSSINITLEKLKLQPVERFIEKTIQLYETINCRHGLMIVGEALSGKSTCYKVLSEAINNMSTKENLEVPVEYHVINPKAVPLEQLYGDLDRISQVWTEGVLAKTFRDCTTQKNSGQIRRWIILDGPVDTLWIENLNTVLDDNKMLCLNNGDIISMSDKMNMLFEVNDLSKASLATVSRCGMIYMPNDTLHWSSLLQSWLKELSKIFDQNLIKRLDLLFDGFVAQSYAFMQKRCLQYVKFSEMHLAINLMKMLDGILRNGDMQEKCRDIKIKQDELISRLDVYFLYALIWSVGCNTNEQGTKKFSEFLRNLSSTAVPLERLKDKPFRIDKAAQLPESTLPLHAYYIDNCKWKLWRERLEQLDKEEHPYEEGLRFHEVVVPTTDSLKFTNLLEFMVSNKIPTLILGPTGTGKTMCVNAFMKNASQDKYVTTFIGFSAQTSANQTQDILETKLEPRKRGVFAPRYPKKLIAFVDDLNMPIVEPCGAQPPIEFLREFLDIGGWFSRDKEKKMRKIEDTILIAAMSPPGGGRNEVTQRLLRHFYVLTFNSFDESVLNRIFSSLMTWHVKTTKLSSDLIKPLAGLANATIEVYNFISERLLHTPEKFHYIFNMRDIARVVQGIQMANLKGASNRKLIRLFIHEISRVFMDRLITEPDKQTVFTFLHKVVREKLREDLKAALGEIIPSTVKIDLNTQPEALKYIVFTDAMSEGISAYERQYDETLLGKPLFDKCNYYLEEYNSASKKPMNLVLFDYAIEHLLRISRILRMAKGNALLVGMGGSGRQSLTKLASFMCEFSSFDIEVPKNYNKEMWREDMKNLLRGCGGDDKKQVFLMSDSQMKFDFILEDVNNLLNTGEIPNLWAHDEKLEIAEKARLVAKKDGRNALFSSGTTEKLYDFFVEKCNFNLHIVMAMSPIGGGLRTKMRLFPSLVNCCSIDWFTRWPESGLRAVADKFLKDADLIEPEQVQIVNLCTDMHTQVQSLSEQFLKIDKRYNYVTPTVYIELIQAYKSLLKSQRESIMKLKLGYSKGIEKLEFATREVEIKQKELEEKSPFLEDMNKKVAELIAKVNKQITEVVEPKKKFAMEEELTATQQAQEAEQLLADCTQELAKFTPKLKEAQNKMDALTSKETNELKTYKDPPKPVKVVLEAVTILRNFPVIYTPNPQNPKEMEPNMWATAKKFLAQGNFLSGFKTFDYNAIPIEIIDKIRKKYIADLSPAKLKDVSAAAYALCLWIRAVEEYDKAYRIVKPKEQRAKEAKEAYKVKRENLKRVQEELQVLVNTLEEMQADLAEKQKKKNELEREIEDCKTKIARARALLEGLGGEKTRWAESIIDLQKAYDNIVGDMLVSAGIIAYLGIFPAKYRNPTIKKWLEKCESVGLKVSSNFSLEKCLGEPVFIHEWVLNGLPTDSFSKENAIISIQSRRWPLMVDPEGQANRWIKNQYQARNLNVVKLADDYMRAFKKAIPFGEPLLLENIGTEIDPALDSLLLKQTFKQAGAISIKLGDGIIDYSKDFLLFITTKLRSPHFLPELSTKVTVIDFALTHDGLKDQLLDLVVQKERQELDEKRSRLIKQNYEYKRELKKREDNILEVLRTTQGNILENESAVNAVKESQDAAAQVKEKQQIAMETEANIEVVRQEYVPIAHHVASLYFIVSNLGKINEMYQYSLSWYLMLFTQAIDTSEKSEFVEQRLEALKEQFTSLLYENVIKSLFEKDKQLFSFLLAVTIQDGQNIINQSEYKFLISSAITQTNVLNLINPCKPWMSENSWNSICLLAKSSAGLLATLPEKIRESPKEWKQYFDSIIQQRSVDSSPRKSATAIITAPGDFAKMTPFEKLCLLKAYAADKFVSGVKDYVANSIGQKFLYYPPFDLEKSFKNAQPSTPLIFVLPGTDPMATLRTFAQARGKLDTMKPVSLGQDQGPIAVKYIEEAKKNGSWVILQNCHLAPSFMPTLEKICDSFQAKVSKDQAIHPSFRLWLTSYATENFPVSVLQSGIKLTNEPPKGSKANMLGSYLMYPISDSEFFNNGSPIFKRLLLGLCFFHSLIQERRSFGPLGWNIPYDYNQSDLFISVKQMSSLLQGVTEENVGKTLKSLKYLIGECNYGGRVTDDKDRRLLNALLNSFFSEEALKPGFCPGGLSDFTYPSADLQYQEYCDYITKELPNELPAELYGFHENAFMSRNLKECNDLLSSMQKVGDSHFQSKKAPIQILEAGNEIKQISQNVGEKKDEDILSEILNKLPDKYYELEAVEKKYPPLYENSMNTVLTQELVRFNILLKTIRSSLMKILSALKGEALMSTELEEVYNSVLLGKIPEQWRVKSYPSLKALGGYINDLKVRLQFFKDWVEVAPPLVYWISGFFFTQSFLTGALQNYARKKGIEIDALNFEFEFFYEDPTDYSLEIMDRTKCKLKEPEDGVYITGLYLEGCRWDFDQNILEESRPKILFSKAPIIWLKPQKSAPNEENDSGRLYSCPVYKTSERRGVLDSTGHSTNYIMDIKMPSLEKPEHWVKRGVAMICQLSI